MIGTGLELELQAQKTGRMEDVKQRCYERARWHHATRAPPSGLLQVITYARVQAGMVLEGMTVEPARVI